MSVQTAEVEEYCAAVRRALDDLTAEQRTELTEDLPDHLAEVLAESEGRLVDRLGEPDEYAAELRAAAGFEARDAAAAPRDDLLTRATAFVRRADVSLGRLFGTRRFVDVLGTLQPAWWILRGWIVAEWLCDHGTWSGIVPRLGSYGAAGGLLAVLACVTVSVLLGARVRVGPNWLRVTSGVASVLIGLWGALVLASASSSAADSGASFYGAAPVNVYNDLYVYDANGNLVPNARIYDQDGNPVDVASGYCQYGDPSVYLPQPSDGAYTYPICRNDPGPFRSGPGAIPEPATGVQPAPTPGPSSSTPAGADTSSRAGTPTTAPPARPSASGTTTN